MNNILELPINKETYERFCTYHKNDPEHLAPFCFYVMGDYENCFVINHGSEDGWLYDNRINMLVKLDYFYKRISKGRMLKDRHLVIICCHGGNIENNMPEKVTIMNKSKEALYVGGPSFSSYFDYIDDEEKFCIHINGCDNWYEE